MIQVDDAARFYTDALCWPLRAAQSQDAYRVEEVLPHTQQWGVEDAQVCASFGTPMPFSCHVLPGRLLHAPAG